MSTCLFSIVVPIYNAEKFLPKCIDSMLAQTFEDFEIVLVNDSSTDRSLDICKFYQEGDSRIRILNQENQGAFAARLNGVRQAFGQYIVFMDADDSCVPTMLEEIKDQIEEKNADCIVYKYDVIDENDVCTHTMPGVFSDNSFFDESSKEAIFRKLVEGDSLNSLWMKCVHRNIAGRDQDFGKASNVVMGEDVIHTLHIFCSAKRIVYMNRALYHYRSNPNSVTSAMKKRYIFDFLMFKHYTYDALIKCGLSALIFPFFRRYFHDLANNLMKMHLVCHHKREYKELYQAVQQTEMQEVAASHSGTAGLFSRIALVLARPWLFSVGKIIAALYYSKGINQPSPLMRMPWKR